MSMSDRITILALHDLAEALGLRAIAEGMGHDVRLLRPGAPAEVPGMLRQAAEDDVMILSAHGGPRGLFMGEYGKGVDVSLMDGPWLVTARAFDGLALRDDAVLISTACATRESGLAEAVFKTGGHLVAPNGDPQGRVILPWIAACLLSAHKGLPAAVAAANALVEPPDRFSYG